MLVGVWVTILFVHMIFYLLHTAVDSSEQEWHVVFGVPS